MIKYIKTLFLFALPIIIGNLGHILIGAGDVIIAGRHSTDTLASISIGSAISIVFVMLGSGILVAVSPVLSNLRGEGKGSERYFKTTVIFALLLALICALLSISIIPFIDKFGFEARLIPNIKEYVFICAFSFFGAYLHFALKEFLQAHENVIFPNALSIFGIFFNLILNWALVFGKLGLPELGVVGLAIATFATRTIMGLILYVYAYKYLNKSARFNIEYIKTLFKVGGPITIAIMLEFIAFNATTLIAGRFSGAHAAANNIIITISAVMFMIPMAISEAMTVKVGFANGAKDYEKLSSYSWAGVLMTFIYSIITALLLLFFPNFLAKLFSQDPYLVRICTPIFYVVAFYQIFDAAQISFSGILKGLKLTKIVTIATFLSYWVFGMPLGLILASKYDYKIAGLWLGLAAALFFFAVILFGFIKYKFKILKKEFS